MSLYIVIPAYNESDNIREVIREWSPVLEQYGDELSRLVVVDDGSTDDTLSILQNIQKSNKLVVLSKENSGHGAALLYGYKYAIHQGADYIFQTDSDRQTVPDEFGAFWELREQYDAIIGTRPDRQDGISRKMVENVLRWMIRLFFGVSLPDANAPFRLMRAERVRSYIRKMPRHYGLPNALLTTFFVYYHDRVKFKKITFKQRGGGEQKINIKRIIRIGWDTIWDFMIISKRVKREESDR